MKFTLERRMHNEYNIYVAQMISMNSSLKQNGMKPLKVLSFKEWMKDKEPRRVKLVIRN